MKSTVVALVMMCVIGLAAQRSVARDLSDLIPGLYGGQGITLAPANWH